MRFSWEVALKSLSSDAPGPLREAGMSQTFRKGLCQKPGLDWGTLQTMLMFHMLLDVPESRDSQRTGWAKVRPQRRKSGGGKGTA